MSGRSVSGVNNITESDNTCKLLLSGSLTLSAACGGGGSGGNPASDTASDSNSSVIPLTAAEIKSLEYAAARFLLHAQFSSTDADIAAVRLNGADLWLNQQMNMPSGESAWDWLTAQGYSAIDSNNNYNNSNQANYMAWHQIMTVPDGVRQRIALALSEFFVVSISGIQLNWPQFAMAAYWDVLTKNAFGNYRNLLEDVTLNLAMGEFLNTRNNQKEDPVSGRQPDENYAREVMQLFTIGLVRLNIDGTPVFDGNGQQEESYTQSDVSNLARVFTGYQSDDTEGFVTLTGTGNRIRNVGYARRPMVLNANRHSTLEANFLGTSIAAGTDGRTALRMGLDTLFNHPNVGPFFGRQMIQRLVSSNPSPAYIARIANVFNDNGSGVRGDLRAVFRAILLDEEANSVTGLTSVSFGKLREPIVRIAQWARTFDVQSISGTWRVGNLSALNLLSQSPLQAASVFNFFRPGYVPPNTALAMMGATAPEFQLVNETSVPSYINYLEAILPRGITVGGLGFDIAPGYLNEMALVGNAAALVERLNKLLTGGQLSSATTDLIVNALTLDNSTTSSPNQTKRNYIAKAIMFVMSSPEYLVQK
jgi:uncharacterized protein (DUF1800 family)